MIKLRDELQLELVSILKKIETRDQPVRDRQLKLLKELELYWKNIHNIFWDDTVKDWRNINDQSIQQDLDTYYADKVINIYRAHGESIIAALTQDLPQTIFVPDDAENQDDLRASEAWTSTSELIARQQKAILLAIRALYLMYNAGTIAGYVYSKASEENGTYKIPNYEKGKVYTDFHICPNCGYDLSASVRTTEADTVPAPVTCEKCGETVIPLVETDEEEVPIIKGYRVENKPRPVIEIYGMLNVRLPHFAANQKECGYLILETESDRQYAKDIAGKDVGEGSDTYASGRWARLDADFDWEHANEITTWRRVWLRPWQFQEAKEEFIKPLQKLFPNGCYFLMMNDHFIECDNESLDEHWVISASPLSNHIHAEPLGLPVKAVQDMRSELVILQLQAMEYGIPETWADPQVIDFVSYNKSEAAPGKVYPVKSAPTGKRLEDSFATLKTAVYPKEAEEFKRSLDQDGQFVLGDFPSIYGGMQSGGSKTYAEYSASQARALQRLSISYKIFSIFWAGVTEKATRIFINEMKEDEKFVKKSGSSWINVWIRRADLVGKIGSVEPETNSAFPMSFTQKKDALIKLLEYKDPAVTAVITHPENAGVVARYLGFPELYIPGDDSRNKQLYEIQEMLEVGQFIIPDPDLDDHKVEYEACLAWLNGPYGLDTKTTNIQGYDMIKEHARIHKQIMDMEAMQTEQMANNTDNQENANANPQVA
jgi:predicted RNA-binding Zn-ribbon protein involved in translation (DUF1610 family)